MRKNNRNSYPAILLTLVFIQILVMTTLTVNITADALNPGIYSIDESPFGTSYSTWIARWWNWTSGISKAEHPRDFEDRNCNVNQIWKDVWFLPDVLDGKYVRDCEVPLDRAIFVPITTGEQSVAENNEFTGKPVSEVKDDLISGAYYCDDHNVERAADIDGKKVLGLEGNSPYRTNTTDLFNITYKENNIYDIKAGTSPGFAEGWFLFVKPLPEGDHTIHIHSKISHPTDVSCNNNGDVVWNIRVK